MVWPKALFWYGWGFALGKIMARLWQGWCGALSKVGAWLGQGHNKDQGKVKAWFRQGFGQNQNWGMAKVLFWELGCAQFSESLGMFICQLNFGILRPTIINR